MAEDGVEVLVLRDAEGNVYALPRKMVERARVPDELKDALPFFQRARPFVPSMVTPSNPSSAGRPPAFLTRVTSPQLPWPVGWMRVPGA